MSRIEEALRRAAGEMDRKSASSPNRADSHQPGSGLLDRYPTEGFGAARPPADEVVDPGTDPHRSRVERFPESRLRASATTVPVEGRTLPVELPAPIAYRIVRRTLEKNAEVSLDPEGDDRLVMGPAVPSEVQQQYERIARRLEALKASRRLKTLVVSSALPREGRTLTAANLALTLNRTCGRDVLLIDADLRAPALMRLFRLPGQGGLSEVLGRDHGDVPVFDVLPKLAVLTAGVADPDAETTLLSSRMKRLIDEIAPGFDWVIIDTPHVSLLPDVNLLAWLGDAVLLVVQAGTTSYRLVQHAVDELGSERIVGTILNQAREQAPPDEEADS
jgi:capsular exopolysaccharide synthesis family protein